MLISGSIKGINKVGMNMQFGEITLHDMNEIRKLQPEGWNDIVPEFEYYVRKEFCFPQKAILDNRIVGVGTLIVFGDTAWLAHIIVDKDHRGRGIGFQITEKLMFEGKSRSLKSLLLIATESGFPVYKKAGFRSISEYQFFLREKPWNDLQVSQKIQAADHELESEIYALDEKISGQDRRSLLKDHLHKTFVYLQDNSLLGVYIPDLGEGLIIASTEEAGSELMKMKYSKADKAVLPGENHAGINFLKQHGFALSDTRGTRMILGQELEWKPKQIFSRIGGNYG
jgi:GNAT superfamily N-acetyltransferase